MTWPTTPVSTTHLDEGSDNPAQARADLKQLADNVNDIVDTFDVVDANNGDILQYNGQEQKFVAKNVSDVVGNPPKIAILNFEVNSQTISALTPASGVNDVWHQTEVSTVTDVNQFVTVNQTSFTLSSGTYFFANAGFEIQNDNSSGASPIYWCNKTVPTDFENDVIKTMSRSFAGENGGTLYFLSPNYYLVRNIMISETFSWWTDQQADPTQNLLIYKLI